MPDIAERYFRQALAHGSLAHGLVFKGQDTWALYDNAMRLAQRLNCENVTEAWDNVSWGACGQCRSCRWTLQNAHPAVLTVSRFTGLAIDKDDKEDYLTQEQLMAQSRKKTDQTQIKTSQVGVLIRQISRSSDATRIVIFTDAEVMPKADAVDDNPLGLHYPAPHEWRTTEGHEKLAFIPRPLNRQILNRFSSNRFLKTLEEPPPGVVIIFLVRNEQDFDDEIVTDLRICGQSCRRIWQ